MTEVTPFELPRKDWYDSQGRIYKDALIENFNAIEARLRELANTDTSMLDSNPDIDITDIHLDDVTLQDDDNKVVNLKSFIDIMKLANFPLTCEFNGTTLVKLTYYDSSYNYKQISKTTVACSNTNKYVYLDYANNEIVANSSTSTPQGMTLIGVYADGSIRGTTSFDYANINAIYYLARMAGERFYSKDRTVGNTANFEEDVNGRRIGGYSGWHERGWVEPVYRDIGRAD